MSFPRYFVFVAQSLDNRSPDPISVQGHFLATDDLRSPERTSLIDDTTFISSRGKEVRVQKGSSCRAFIFDQTVLVEITTKDRDAGGRASPILCLGRLDQPNKSVWRDVALGELDEFANKIDRNIDAYVVSDFTQLIDRIFASQQQRLPRPIVAVRDALTSRTGTRSSDEDTQEPITDVKSSQERFRAEATRESDSGEPYNEPRAVLVLNAVSERLVRSKPNLAVLLDDPDVMVLDLPVRGATAPKRDLASRLDNLGLMQSPSLVLRDPYDPTRYFRAEDLGVELAKSKHRAYQNLCQLLGAKEVVVESVSELTRTTKRSRKVSGSVDAGAGAKVSGTSSAESTLRADLTEQFRLEQKHLGGQADLLAADKFMRDRNLGWDGDLSHLVDVVRNQKNPPKELSLNFSTKQAIDRVTRDVRHLDIAIVGLGLDHEVHERYNAIYRFEMSVSF